MTEAPTLFDPSDQLLGWPPCMNPECDRPGTMLLRLFGRDVGHACQPCTRSVTSRTQVEAHPPRMPVVPADADLDGRSRTAQPDTSRRAADASRWRRGSQRVAIARAHYDHPDGLTDHEAADAAGIGQGSSPWRRCGELREWGYLEHTGTERPTPTGADAVVWRLTNQGRAALEASGHVDPAGP